MNFVSLFAGIGGFDLDLERAGMTCVGQVEIDPFCRAVLAKHWPDVPRMNDVREFRGTEFGEFDLLCGGVPCQPASCAGKRKGADDDRWLWGEWIRIVRAARPAWFVAENVRGFLSLPAAGGVVRDLEGAGYVFRPLLLGAHHLGAPHRRDRYWIVGYSDRIRQQAAVHTRELQAEVKEVPRDSAVGPMRATWPPRPSHVNQIPRMVDGLSRGVSGFARERAFTALGNAVVPAVAEVIGRAIMHAEQEYQREELHQ